MEPPDPPSAHEAIPVSRGVSSRIKPIATQRRISHTLPIVIIGLVLIVIALVTPDFLTARNITNILLQSAPLGLMAMGLAAVLVGGGIDLSIPAIMALSGILGSLYMKGGGNPVLAGLIMVMAGTFLGAINGFAVTYLKMIPFVVTLSMLYVATGFSVWVTNAVSVTGLNPGFLAALGGRIFMVPVPIVVLLVAAGIVSMLMSRSIFGRWIYAIGTNVKAARVSGVPTRGVAFATYVFSGLMAGVAAILTTGMLQAAAASMGQESVVLDVVSSAVVGGVSIYGGVGSALGAGAGAVAIILISNVMNLLHVEYYTTLTIKGIVIIVIVALDALRNR